MALWRRVANLFARTRVEREIDAELEAHLALRAEDNEARGMAPVEARREARVRFGSRAAIKEQTAGEDMTLVLLSIWWDVRYACRQLRKNPGFACTAILVLALGIGASVALFAFVDAALIKPLPFAAPNRLADVSEVTGQFPRANLSYLDYMDYKRMSTVFQSIDVHRWRGFLLHTGALSEPVHGAKVTAGFFRTLGMKPALGRDFAPDADQPQSQPTLLISDAAWKKRFGGSASAIGQTVKLDDQTYTLIGVLPASFQFALQGDAEFWVPLRIGPPGPQTPSCYWERGSHCLFGVARLKDGVTFAEARSQVQGIAATLERMYPVTNRGQGGQAQPLSEAIVGKVRPLLLSLLGGAGLLLAIACLNVASLLLVRTENRRREVSLRSALGASRGRLLRQFVTESLLLVGFGGALGVAAAVGAMQLLLKLVPKYMLQSMPYLEGLGLNWHVLAFAGVVCLFAAAIFSATPLVRLAFSAGAVREGLAEAGRGSSGTLWRRLGANLVSLELAIAMVLLVGAGLLGKSFYKLLHVELGFVPQHLAAMDVALPEEQYRTPEQQRAATREMLRRLDALPGILSSGTSNDLAVNGNGDTRWVRFIGKPYNGEHNEVNERNVSADYLRTLGATLLRGSYFSDDLDATKPGALIINETFARTYYPGEDPIGKQVGNFRLDPDSIWTIVGVIADVREGGLDEPALPAIYHPYNQNPDTDMVVVVRTRGDAGALLPSLVKTVHELDPGISASNTTTVVSTIDSSPAAYLHRSAAWLVGGFAGLALALSVVGLYGVIAYSVSQRTREIGVRMALGAARSSVTALILRQAGRLIAIGIVTGVFCAVGAAMLMRKLLFDTAAWDVPTLVVVAAVLGLSALLASYLPALRAASVNPVEALRAE